MENLRMKSQNKIKKNSKQKRKWREYAEGRTGIIIKKCWERYKKIENKKKIKSFY